MRKIAALLAAVPFAAFGQQSAPPPPQYAPPPPSQPAPAAQPAQYAPPPQYAPAPPQYAPPAPPAPPPQQYLPPQKQRGSWYIGFGLGGGDGSLRLRDAGSMSFEDYVGPSPTQLTLNFKVGATMTPKLLLGFDITAIRSAWEDGGNTAAAQVTNYMAVATYFPTERGFFLRGGAGLSVFGVEAEATGASFSDSTSGVSVLGGIGYAFWLGRSFNLTLNLDLSAQSYGSQNDALGLLPESSRFWALYVGFDWY